jgi:hypothetical protein
MATLPAAHLFAGRMGIGRAIVYLSFVATARTWRLCLGSMRSISETAASNSSPRAHRYPDQSSAAQ